MNDNVEQTDWGKFLRELEEPRSVANMRRCTVRTKYQVPDIGSEAATLADGIEIIDQLRTFAKNGILVSVGGRKT